jgi:hypothetical protein
METFTNDQWPSLMNVPVTYNVKEFWHVRYPPASVEWEFAVHKLISSVEVLVWNDWIKTKHDESGDMILLLKKERYPIELLARTFGISKAQILKLEMIVLDAPKANTDLPTPTVNYWGTA